MTSLFACLFPKGKMHNFLTKNPLGRTYAKSVDIIGASIFISNTCIGSYECFINKEPFEHRPIINVFTGLFTGAIFGGCKLLCVPAYPILLPNALYEHLAEHKIIISKFDFKLYKYYTVSVRRYHIAKWIIPESNDIIMLKKIRNKRSLFYLTGIYCDID
jgi:hypothetical protein